MKLRIYCGRQKPPTRFVIETSQLITLAVCCGYDSNLIGRRTINIPEIILGVHGLMGFTVMVDEQVVWNCESGMRNCLVHVGM